MLLLSLVMMPIMMMMSMIIMIMMMMIMMMIMTIMMSTMSKSIIVITILITIPLIEAFYLRRLILIKTCYNTHQNLSTSIAGIEPAQVYPAQRALRRTKVKRLIDPCQ